MSDETLLSNLLCKVQDFVSEQNYCKETWYLYHAAMNCMRRFYEQNGRQDYSPELSWECVLERRRKYESGKISYDTFLYVWKVAEMLEDCHSNGLIVRRQNPGPIFRYRGKIQTIPAEKWIFAEHRAG